MKRVLILGGGFGGIATARRLKQMLDDKDEVILVDRRDYFMVGFRKTWALTGQSTLEEGQRPLDSLTSLGVRVMLCFPAADECTWHTHPPSAKARAIATGGDAGGDDAGAG